MDTLELFFSFAVSDFISDVIILVLPIPLVSKKYGVQEMCLTDKFIQIWKLQLPFDRKLGVLLVFLLGTL